MVVFAYCSALVAEPYPKAWGSRLFVFIMGIYCILSFFLTLFRWSSL
ncbi:unnamed protein product [Staurois parvus]|uniref:Uncharacterized protein n=1 Tax=Staurois parvus TaxID=386267 RepID=A0ABN9AMG2_9NEOB|nr:unnamed protein product [Staurois parvus]